MFWVDNFHIMSWEINMSHIYENTLHCQNLIGDLGDFESEYLLTFIEKYIKNKNKTKK